MQAARLTLKNGVAAPLLAEVLHDLGKNVLQVLERDDHRGVQAVELHPADVERGAIAVAGILGCGTVASHELGDAVHGAGHAGDLDAVLLAAALFYRVLESIAYLLEQLCCLGHQIRHRSAQVVQHIGVTGENPDQRLVDAIGVAQACDRLEAVFLGRHELQGVAVVEDFLEGALFDIGGQPMNVSIGYESHAVTGDAAVDGHGRRCLVTPCRGILSLTLAAVAA